MKNITLLMAFLVFLGINAKAQWTDNTSINTLVAESESGDMQSIGTSEGKTYVVFWKTVAAPTNYELRLQVLDAFGNLTLGPDGILVSDNLPMSTYTVMWTLEVDSDDNLYIGVTGTGNSQGYVFKMDISGNHLWDANNVSFASGYKTTILPLSNGDVIVSWDPFNLALMQKYDANGNALWASPKPIEGGNGKTSPGNLFELANGDFIMVFHSYSNGINSTLYAQKYNYSGVPLWTNPTQISNKTTVMNRLYAGTQDGDHVYMGYFGASSSRFDSYVQRINSDGTIPWGINGADFDTSEDDNEFDTQIAIDEGSQYIWSICNYSNPNQSQFGEYVQKFDKETGARQFTEFAKLVYPISTNSPEHIGKMFLFEGQPVFLLKEGMDNGATPTTLAIVRLDDNGDFYWPEESKPMATYSANKKRVQFNKPINGQSVAVFIEEKAFGEKIYAQNFMDEVIILDTPNLIYPTDDATNIDLDLTFIWQSVTGADYYQLQVATDADFANLLFDQSAIINPNFDYTLPDELTEYFWRVNAHNSSEISDWSEVWSFTTEGIDGIIEAQNNDLKVYPNPATNYINIDFNSIENTDVQLKIYNSMGSISIIKNENITQGMNSIRIDLQKLASGNYYYQIIGNNINLSGRFFK